MEVNFELEEEIRMEQFEVGDVIKYSNVVYVVADIKNRETYASLCYDREYLLCDEEFVRKHCGMVTKEDLENDGWWLEVKGSSFPDYEKVDMAPYDITPVECFNIRQKKLKVITAFEYE